MTKSEFALVCPSIPSRPGIYKYFDKEGKIIYVGKAKNILKRVSSYFNKLADNYKTTKLVSEISNIEYSIVDSEQDAFLLENSLIKQYQPKYNMMLKDDKTYPHLVIKNERFPRVFLTRRKINDGSVYLGPYTSVEQVRSMLDFIRQTIPLRNCNLNLTQKNIDNQKFKPCLEYHLGNCKAPCAALQTEEDYSWHIHQVKELFKGKLGELLKHYKALMKEHAGKMEFEKAELVRKKIEYIGTYQSKSIVVNSKNLNLDVCTLLSNNDIACFNYMVLVQGSIVHTHTTLIEKKLDESDEEIYQFVLKQMREKFESSSREIVVPIQVNFEEGILITLPRLGDKKKLIELSMQNTQHAMQEYRRKQSLLIQENSEAENQKLLEQLKNDLKLKDLPHHIECFDNSNFQGSYPVAAMVCFKNALPEKKEYRHFHIKTVSGINDFASMKEIVFRRYKRVLEEAKSIPQLIIIDGGKGQLSAALESIRELKLDGKTTVVGLAKNVEEIFFPGDTESLKLPFQSASLNLIKQIRNEVHRFGITFHRNTRSKGTLKNELETIPGIGEKTATELLKKFKSVKKIRQMGHEELSEVIGNAKTKIILDYFEATNQA